MFKVNDVVVHKRDICKITGIIKDFKINEDYYTLVPIGESSLIIHTPVSNKFGLIRNVISCNDAELFIKEMVNIEAADVSNKIPEKEYEVMINSGKIENLVRVIKATDISKEEKISSGKKVGLNDKKYLILAEKLLYAELSVAFNKPYQETKDYVTKIVMACTNNQLD